MRPARRESGSPWGKRLRWALLLLVLFVFVGGFALYRMVTYAPPPPPAPATPPAQAQQAIGRVERQMDVLHQYSATHVQTPYRIQVRQDDVNAYVATRRGMSTGQPGLEGTVRDVRVAFQGGRVTITGYITARGRPGYVTGAGRVIPDGSGGVAFDPDQMLVGKLPMPGPMRAQITARLQEELRRRAAAMGVSVQSIEASQGVLVIQGVTGRRNQ